MSKSDKKNHTFICCEHNFTRSEKLCKHYANTKNQCHLLITSSQPVQALTPQVKGQGSIPVVHVQERDRRSVKPKEVIPTPETSSRKEEDQVGVGDQEGNKYRGRLAGLSKDLCELDVIVEMGSTDKEVEEINELRAQLEQQTAQIEVKETKR